MYCTKHDGYYCYMIILCRCWCYAGIFASLTRGFGDDFVKFYHASITGAIYLYFGDTVDFIRNNVVAHIIMYKNTT